MVIEYIAKTLVLGSLTFLIVFGTILVLLLIAESIRSIIYKRTRNND